MAARCEVTAREGVTALAMSVVGAAGFGPGSAGSEVTDSKLIAEQATTENMGYYSRGTPGAIWKRVEVHVSGASSSTGIWLSQVPPFWEGYFEHVTVNVVGGGPNVGLYTEGGHHDPMRMFVVDSAFRVFGSSETSYGLRFGPFAFESVRLHLHRSHVIGQSAALYSDAPFQEWEGLGPPLVILMTDTLLQGDIELNRHYLGCTAIISAGMLYADTCPPGDWTPSPR
jgi:hypothetical protein